MKEFVRIFLCKVKLCFTNFFEQFEVMRAQTLPITKPSSVNAAPILFFLLSFSLQLNMYSTKLSVCKKI